MAVTSQVPLVRYVAGGGTDFAFNFRVPVAEHLKVFVAGVLITTGYTLSGIGDPAGGTLTFAIAPASGTRIVLARQTPIERTSDYVEGGALRASELDYDFDALIYMNQDTRADAITRTEFQTIADQIETNTGIAEAAAATAMAEASNAGASAAAAVASQIAASGSESAASASQLAAAGSASTAADSEDAADVSATYAASSALAASMSASNAATSATNASNSEDAADVSATYAASHASAASASAGTAATHASNASDSADQAAASAASVDAGNLVQVDTAQTITGTKTFEDILVPTESAGVSSGKAASTAFVDRVRGLSVISTGATTATASGRGALYDATGAITIPASVFAAGDTFTIYNDTASSIAITQGSGLTLRQVGTANTGSRTLAQRGLASVVFIAATEAVISGGGLS